MFSRVVEFQMGKSLNFIFLRRVEKHLFIFSNGAPVGRYSKLERRRPAALELAVVAAGHRGVPTQPEAWLIGRIEKLKTVRKRRRPPVGWAVGK